MEIVKIAHVMVYLTTIRCGFGPVSGNTLNLLRDACPYTDFCTMNSTRPYTRSNESVPCCFDCLCDEYCSLFDDCCPDVDQSRTKFKDLKLKCRQARTSSKFADSKSVGRKLPSYRFVDFCPPEYQGSSKIKDKCEREVDGNSDFEDLVLVSDKQQRIFKNKHCAICHGVLQVRSWNLNILECSWDVREMQLVLSASRSYMLENCLLISQRPRDVPVTARTLECENVDECDGQADDVKDGCLNGPYMPYAEVQRWGTSSLKMHKNVFCFQCHGRSNLTSLCPKSVQMVQRGFGASYNTLLNHKMTSTPTIQKSECREHELMDPYKGKCRQLFCPPFEMVSYGKCVPFSDVVSNLFVVVSIVYNTQNIPADMSQTNQDTYNQSMLQHHLNQIYSKYGYPHCEMAKIAASARVDKSSANFSLLILELTYISSKVCTIRYIGEQIKQTQSSNKTEHWFLNDMFYEMYAQFTFEEIVQREYDPKYEYRLLIYHSTQTISSSPMKAFFICPYFILSYEEYSNYVEKLGSTDEAYNRTGLTSWSQYLNGFYSLRDNEVAACIQNYLPKNGFARCRQERATLVLIVISVVYAHAYS